MNVRKFSHCADKKNYYFRWHKKISFQLDRAHDQIVLPLEGFRKDAIGSVKEKKKQHDKKTAKFCQAQEKILNLSSKKPEAIVVEVNCKFHSQMSHTIVIIAMPYQNRKKLVFTSLLFIPFSEQCANEWNFCEGEEF